MSFPNRLPANSYEGTIDGIEIRWGPSAITRLSDNASLFPAGLETMKGVTEDLGYACAKRLGKNRVKILYVIIHVLSQLFIQYPNYLLGAHSMTIPPIPQPGRDVQMAAIARMG